LASGWPALREIREEYGIEIAVGELLVVPITHLCARRRPALGFAEPLLPRRQRDTQHPRARQLLAIVAIAALAPRFM
jgi:hypothetical protein